LAEDRLFLTSISPLRRLDALAAPLLLSHGTHDVRVCVEQSRRARDARQGCPYPTEYHEVPGEGHGYRITQHREQFIECMHRFLSQHVHSIQQ
jgi:dipeptidyl aminopeptidase/acylaminoacyl peptidase